MSDFDKWLESNVSTYFIISHLEKFFKNNDDKIKDWLETKNPNLGNLSPLELIKRGRAHKVLEFVESAMEENKK